MKLLKKWKFWLIVVGFSLGVILILMGSGIVGESSITDTKIMRFEGGEL